jgi:multiple sugar transport system permease protein
VSAAGRLTTSALVGAAALASLLPFLWMVATSLKAPELVLQYPPVLLAPPRWANFAEAWRAAPFGRYTANTAFVAATVTLLELLTCSLAAFAFARLRFRGREALFALYLGVLMLPGQVTIVPNFVLMRWLGWVDTYFALVIPAAFSALGTFLLRQYFLTIPRELEQAARIDGCGPFGVYARIVLPLAGPALATLAILAFVAQWNAFLWPLIVTNSDEMRTLTVGLRFFVDSARLQYHLLMAAAVTACLPTLLLYLVGQRWVQPGVALSGFGGR